MNTFTIIAILASYLVFILTDILGFFLVKEPTQVIANMF